MATFFVSVLSAPLVDVYVAPQNGRLPLTELILMMQRSFWEEILCELRGVAHRTAEIGVHHMQHPLVACLINDFLLCRCPALFTENVQIAECFNGGFENPLGVFG